jgi:hypothetical protein
MRVLELGLGESLMVVDGAIANELNLRYTRNGLEIRMKDRLLSAASLVVTVTVAFRLGIECLWITVKRCIL